MSRLIKVQLDEQSYIYIETCDAQTDETDPMFAPASSVSGCRVIERSKEYITSVIEHVKSFSSNLSQSVKNVADEVEIEFSIKIGADSGIIISSVNSEACFTIKLKWEKKEHDE